MRKLTLRKESLTELTAAELTEIAGGTRSAVVCLTNPCVTRPVTGIWCLEARGE